MENIKVDGGVNLLLTDDDYRENVLKHYELPSAEEIVKDANRR